MPAQQHLLLCAYVRRGGLLVHAVVHRCHQPTLTVHAHDLVAGLGADTPQGHLCGPRGTCVAVAMGALYEITHETCQGVPGSQFVASVVGRCSSGPTHRHT